MELLPCPFCGGEAELDNYRSFREYASGRMSRQVAIFCRDCTAEISVCVPDVPDIQPEQVVEMWNRRASPAGAPEGFNHSIGADRFTTVRGTYWWHVRAGDGTQNIGKFHTKLAAEDMALTLLTAFRDGAFMQYGAMLGSAPTPPSTEDRKDAERYQWLVANSFDKSGVTQFHIWKHSWEPHSKTGEQIEWSQRIRGPALDTFIDAAMQEDKP